MGTAAAVRLESEGSKAPEPGHLGACDSCEVRSLGFCRRLDERRHARLSALAVGCGFERHQTIFHEGDEAAFVFAISSGTAKIYKLLPDGRRQVTGFLFPGDFLGFALGDRYGFTAEAVEEARLCRFPRDRFESFLAAYPELQQHLLSMAIGEIEAMQDQILLLGRKSARERVASFLMLLSREAARHPEPSDRLHVPMTRGEIGDYLGLTTETVSRTLGDFRNETLIKLTSPWRIAITRPRRLKSIADGTIAAVAD
jgi:CRP/FNR family transcriptional regulator